MSPVVWRINMMMGKVGKMVNIYVGNLDYNVREEDLDELFAKHGSVDRIKVVMEPEADRNRGFGFVQMEDQNEAFSAIEDLNGTDFKGRRLIVNKARERTRDNGSDRRPNNGGTRGYQRSDDGNFNRR